MTSDYEYMTGNSTNMTSRWKLALTLTINFIHSKEFRERY